MHNLKGETTCIKEQAAPVKYFHAKLKLILCSIHTDILNYMYCSRWKDGKPDGQTDGRKEQTPPAKVFSCQIGIDFMQYSQQYFKLLFLMEGRKDGRTESWTGKLKM